MVVKPVPHRRLSHPETDTQTRLQGSLYFKL